MTGIWIYLVFVAAGIGLGYLLPTPKWMGRFLGGTQSALLYALMFLMGMTLGLDTRLHDYIWTVGFQAFVMAFAAVAGSVAMTLVLENVFLRLGSRLDFFYEDVEEGKSSSTIRMAFRILLFLLAGFLAVRHFAALAPFAFVIAHRDVLLTTLLGMMIFSAGMDVGRQRSILTDIRRSGWGLLIVPLGTLVGSIAGAVIAGLIVGVKPISAGAAGAGCGWFTLSGAVLSNVDARLGALAFLLNLVREMTTPLTVPFVSKRFGPFAAVSQAGAASMDTMLGVVTRCTNPAMAIVSFANGLLLSAVVPTVLSLFIRAL